MRKPFTHKISCFVLGVALSLSLPGCGEEPVDTAAPVEDPFADPTLQGTDSTAAGSSTSPDATAENEGDAGATADPGLGGDLTP